MRSLLAGMAVITALAFAAPSSILTPPQIIKHAIASLVKIDATFDEGDGVCAGFVIDAPKHYILTAAHCVGENLKVDGSPATVVGLNADLAVITSPTLTKSSLVIASNLPERGEVVVTVGYGYGHLFSFVRHVAGYDDADLVLDSPEAPGTSGGPILNSAGEVVALAEISNSIISAGVGVEEIRTFVKHIEDLPTK